MSPTLVASCAMASQYAAYEPPEIPCSNLPDAATRACSSTIVSIVTPLCEDPKDTMVPPKPKDTPLGVLSHLGGLPHLVETPRVECAWTLRSKEHVDTTPRIRGDHWMSYLLVWDELRLLPYTLEAEPWVASAAGSGSLGSSATHVMECRSQRRVRLSFPLEITRDSSWGHHAIQRIPCWCPCNVARGMVVEARRSHSFIAGFRSSEEAVRRCRPSDGFQAISDTDAPDDSQRSSHHAFFWLRSQTVTVPFPAEVAKMWET